ncbi:MAG TPA: hypothetical protein PKG54_00950 [Phycisphaerae bacterium]|jgi:hypothetical protein|nr:hypothetical protein [Phycisphaerae bacterium]HOB73067.1 hypothetical protein [Phycisphaerae bacterium]HOJ54052.1 hypothetical protein [Phycisphaerae bacterium]HOL26463.1 hypothetical protein [Phycisphaerae bacterium]HPP20442.1 hypothetical protein [Phycisphaerae bacterium]
MDPDDGSESIPPAEPAERTGIEASRKPWRLWLALIVGVALALPTSWVLAMLAMLPRLLGLFFFLVAGLLIGAVMYRIGLPAAPVPRARLYVAGLAVALVLWLAGLMVEYQALPRLAFGAVRGTMKFSIGPERKEHIQNTLRSHIEARLDKDYPPGGLIGYVRWVATNGRMRVPRVIDNTTILFELSQRRGWWIVRAGLSLVFLAGTILSQVSALGPPRRVETGEEDEETS